MMPAIQTTYVQHLGGSLIGYRQSTPHDPSRPTLVLVNSFSTSSLLYRAQFEDASLNRDLNLLALEPYGHGATRAPSEQFTYWDSAIANLQVLEGLGIANAFVLGTSQGGWIAARMAMLAPHCIRGLLLLGTSMDAETEESRQRGCWNANETNTPLIDILSTPVGDDWCPPDEYCDSLIDAGLGADAPEHERKFWRTIVKQNYRGDEGRRRLRVCAINLRDRDGLNARLDAIDCPVLWLHGTRDAVYSVANAEDGIARFTRSPDAQLKVVEGGHHFLSASDPTRVNEETLDFIRRPRRQLAST